MQIMQISLRLKRVRIVMVLLKGQPVFRLQHGGDSQFPEQFAKHKQWEIG